MGPLGANILDWGTVAAAVSSLIFLLGSTWVFPWYDSPAGRAMVSIDGVLFLALLPALLHHIFGVNTQTTFFIWYYAASLWTVAGVTLWRLVTLWLIQRNGRNGSR
jgi:hypothetical protein